MNHVIHGSCQEIDAYVHGSILLEQLVEGCSVGDVDGLQHIHYGRPKVGILHEIVARDDDVGHVVSVVAQHPAITPAYLSTFAALDNDEPSSFERAGLPRVVRNTLMTVSLANADLATDAHLTQLTDASELHALALTRGDTVLDVDAFSDQIRCYVLDIAGEPVSSALLVPSIDRTAMIEHVHTLTTHRRQGFGRRLLRAIHAEARQMGIRRVVLGSNDTGRPLYESLGYLPICHQDVYVLGL